MVPGQGAMVLLPRAYRLSSTLGALNGMTTLVIVESPAKAKTIASFLGRSYRVEASYGHIRDLPAGRKSVPEKFRNEPWAEFGVNIDNDFEPVYVVSAEKTRQIKALKDALKDADRLLLATDEDREGESISWHLLEVLKPRVPVSRIVFHEITREAIREALESPRAVDEALVRAQESRRILDRLFGYKLSPVLWRKVQPGLSAGRVQSVAVRLIVEREEERRRFVTASYWDIEAEFGAAGAQPFKATLTSVGGKRLATGKDFDATTGKLTRSDVLLLDKAKAEELERRLYTVLPWKVTRVEEKPASQRPYPPFTTSTLQQEANRKLGFGSDRTMRAAQRLYEGVELSGETVGLITYMRTDSVSLSEKALRDAQAVIREMYGPDYADGPRQYKTKTRNAQEAHEAIRPTEMHRRPSDVARFLQRDELALYELIWKRTMASQMPDARLLRTSVDITAHSEKGTDAIFQASGKRILFPGFLRAYVEGSDDPSAEIGDQEVILPDLKEGQSIPAAKTKGNAPCWLESTTPKGHDTAPPARYTEASLVKKLEEEGIGRPSTYASIISTIQDRGYVYVSKSRQLVPTFTAMITTGLLREHFPEYVDIKFTARMEEELDEIAGGRMTWTEHLRAFYRGTGGKPGFESLVESKKETIPFPSMDLGRDPDSGQPVQLKVGKYGPYILRGENGNSQIANVPPEMTPEELTLEKALALLSAKQEGPRALGTDPASGEKVYATTGRFGAYVQLGETPEDTKKGPKPRRASLERGQQVESITLQEALALLAFPRELGTHPDSGEPVLANKGKYGPYVQHQKDYRSLKGDDDPSTITFERALELLAEPKASRFGKGSSSKKALKSLGKTAEGAEVQVMEGRYGAYVTNGEVNATIPDGLTAETVTLEQALELLAARAGSAKPAKGRKKPAAKSGATKAAPKTKRPARKKS